MKHALPIAAGILAAFLALPAFAADAPATEAAITAKLIGAWNLIEIRERDAATGAEKPATPASAGGQLIYTANGRLSLQIARVGYEKTGANGFASYFGRWEVVPAESYVLHRQDGNLNAAQAGQAAKRYYSFDAQGHLSLATPPAKSADGRMLSTVFVWERFP